MKIDCIFVQLHAGDSMFFAGKNFQTKLDAKRDLGLKLTYDTEEKELNVQYAGQTTQVPSTSIFHYQPIKGNEDIKAVKTHTNHAMKKGISSAQVQTPTDHVFKGPGAGQTKQ